MSSQDESTSGEHSHSRRSQGRHLLAMRRRRKRLHAKYYKMPRESSDVKPVKFERPMMNLFNHVIKREIYGLGSEPVRKIASKQLSKTVPIMVKEREMILGSVNKVFASQWLNDSRVVMGTKCNKILIKDVLTDDTIMIPSLKGSGKSEPADCPCGIHSIAINPSRTLLATGADNTNDLAVYRLPSFDPVFIGEGGHTDWIFDMKWVDDEYCFTGSRDSKLALWKVRDYDDMSDSTVSSFISSISSIPSLNYQFGEPVEMKICDDAEKIRALAYNDQSLELGVLSLNNKIHTWDVLTFSQKDSRRLPYTRETVCMTYDVNKQVYAVGSQSHVTLMDRDLKPVLNIESLQKGFGIRSVSFNENIITIGTGLGSILFYDLNAGKYLECCCGNNCVLHSGAGFLKRDDMWRDYFSGLDYHNAIYTHCYDDSGCRLFAAGGPLPASLFGNYAGVWQ